MRILAISALALAACATPAFAQDSDKGFTGFHVTALGGLDHVEQAGDFEDGAAYAAAVGYDFQMSSVVVGVEGEVGFATTETCVDDACAEAGRDLYAGARVGLPVGEKALIYVKAGYTNAQIRYTLDGDTLFTDELDGVRGGVGVETNVGPVLMRAEYRYSNYSQDISRHQALFGVGLRF